MKKIITLVLALAMVSTAAFAKKWTNNIGLGFDMAFSSLEFDEDSYDIEPINENGFGLSVTYVGFHQNGFCVKADESIGVVNGKQDGESVTGSYNNLTFGAGWALVHDEKVTFTVTGMLGFDLSTYEEEEKYLGVTTEYTHTFLSFSIGADAFFSYRLKENFGLFANLGIYFLPAGSAEMESKTDNVTTTNDYDLNGKYRVSPSFGIAWNF